MAVRSNLYLQAGGQGSEGPLLAPRLYNSNGTLPESPPELPMALIGGVGGTLGPLSLLCGGSPSNCWTSNLTSSWVKSPLSYPSLSYPAAGALGAGVWVSGGKISLGRRRRRREVMELELREVLGRRNRASRVGEDTLATLLFRYYQKDTRSEDQLMPQPDQHFVQRTLFGKGDTFMLYNSTGTFSLFQAIGIIRCFIKQLRYIQ